MVVPPRDPHSGGFQLRDGWALLVLAFLAYLVWWAFIKPDPTPVLAPVREQPVTQVQYIPPPQQYQQPQVVREVVKPVYISMPAEERREAPVHVSTTVIVNGSTPEIQRVERVEVEKPPVFTHNGQPTDARCEQLATEHRRRVARWLSGSLD